MSECGEVMDVFYPCGDMGRALEYDVMSGMMTSHGIICGVWDRDRGARAYGNVVCPRVEMVQVVCIEAMGHSKMEKSGCDEVMAHCYGSLDTWRGFISIGRHTGNIGGMVEGGIISEDLLPHCLFWWGVIVKDGWLPIVRSIGYLHLIAPLLHLIPKLHPSGGAQPLPLISDEIYGSVIVVIKVSRN